MNKKQKKTVKQAIAILQIVGGLLLSLPIALKIFSVAASAYYFFVFLAFLAIGITSIVAGIFLLQNKKQGINLSILVQFLQVPILNIPGMIGYRLILGLSVGPAFNFSSGLISVLTNFGGSFSFSMGQYVSRSLLVGFNVIPIIVLMFLSQLQKKK